MTTTKLHSEAILRDLLAGSGIPALVRLGAGPGHVSHRPDSEADAEALLNTPVAALKEPLEVFCSVLGQGIYLVANDTQAATVRARGGVPYCPEEVAILREIWEAVDSNEWARRLALIHEAKVLFEGSVTE